MEGRETGFSDVSGRCNWPDSKLVVGRPSCCCVDQSAQRMLGCSVCPSVGGPVAQSVDRSLGRSVGRSVGLSFGSSKGRSIGMSVFLPNSRVAARSIGRSVDRLVGRLGRAVFDRSAGPAGRLIGRAVVGLRSAGLPIARLVGRLISYSPGRPLRVCRLAGWLAQSGLP